MKVIGWGKKKQDAIDMNHLPMHIGFIMDGNGRWAKKRGLSRSMGHKAGAKSMQGISKVCQKLGIKVITLYAFSTENWRRPKEEVDALMDLLYDYLRRSDELLGGEDVRIKILGDRSILNKDLIDMIEEVEEKTKDRIGMICNIALNYGGREEITNVVKKVIDAVENNELTKNEITSEKISEFLYTAGQADPDLIIRTSGEMRMSNFLIWQSAYAELCFPKVLWPDFDEKELIAAIIDYQLRNRRYGGV